MPTRPSRKRRISPASASSFRWREMRGCDCFKISVRSRHGELGLGQQREDAQARVFAGSLQRRVEGIDPSWVLQLMTGI